MHLRPGRLLPWLPTYAAVALLLGLLVFALVSLRPPEPRRDVAPVPPPPAATPPFLAGPAPPSTAPAPPRRTAPPPEVTGRYRVIDTYRDSFIGEVRVANAASRSRTWTVRLRFSSTDTLRAFWVEGAPKPELARSGDTFTFTGAAPVAAGKAAPLRFHFDRDGPVPTLTACSVNGRGCTLTTGS
ncbi:cellulose binding domain-containing protein [Phytohabitans houttuyneae]|uniref:CBM2 domain-containing protein n=1 Tax=Phytohabitans houttuyneae TaxID=1076126 RepID=A0A6V8KND1_9ACTN|nr:cellulose binding domain-containing protein [Phytohabitans houttuyneae]GFJ83267.1 hypothetical protein Phou_074470 [Phytohabitans houttuyneae]